LYDYRVAQIMGIGERVTIRCIIDLGFGLSAMLHFRLLGIDPPESYDEEIIAYVNLWLNDRELIARTTKLNGTAVGINDVWLADLIDARSGEHLTTALIDAGYGS
jgi:hypothetical protein